MRKIRAILLFLVFLVLCFYYPITAIARQNHEGHIFRVKVKQVGLSLSIPGLTNGAITKLRKENFRVWEKIKNGKGEGKTEEQEIINFAVFKDQPAAIIIAIDSSESMNPDPQKFQGSYVRMGGNKLMRAKIGATDLIQGVFKNGDLGLISEFFTETHYDDQGKITNGGIRYVYINQSWTPNRETLNNGIKNIDKPLGATPIRQAIYLLSDQFLSKDVSGNYLKIIVIISDGLESELVGGSLGGLSTQDVIRKLEDSQILVYSIGLYEKSSSVANMLSRTNESNILEDSAYATGGKSFFAGDLNRLPKVFAEIEESIRNIVYLSYAPKSDTDGPREIIVELGSVDKDGKWHKRNVKGILHRRGYTYKKGD